MYKKKPRINRTLKRFTVITVII